MLAVSIVNATPTHALLGPLDGVLQGLLGTNKETTQANNAPVTPAQVKPAEQTSQRPSVAPVQAAQQPTPAPASTTAPQQSQVVQTAQLTQSQQSQQNSAAAIAPVEASTTDTAPIVKQLASAQTRQASAVVTYPSLRIDSDKRDQLFAIATSVIIVGSSLYGMTLMKLSQRSVVASRRPLYIK